MIKTMIKLIGGISCLLLPCSISGQPPGTGSNVASKTTRTFSVAIGDVPVTFLFAKTFQGEGNEVYIPLADLVEALGGEIVWDPNSKQFIINRYDNKSLIFNLTKNQLLIDGMTYGNRGKIAVKDSITFINLDFVRIYLGCLAALIEANSTVYLYKTNEKCDPAKCDSISGKCKKMPEKY